MATIVTTHERVARSYFDDGTISLAIPPLRALLEIMADGVTAEGWALDSPEFRALFTREAVLASDWYAARLDAKQAAASGRADAGLAAIEKFVSTPGNEEPTARLDMPARVEAARLEAKRLAGPEFRDQLIGTAGSTPSAPPGSSGTTTPAWAVVADDAGMGHAGSGPRPVACSAGMHTMRS